MKYTEHFATTMRCTVQYFKTFRQHLFEPKAFEATKSIMYTTCTQRILSLKTLYLQSSFEVVQIRMNEIRFRILHEFKIFVTKNKPLNLKTNLSLIFYYSTLYL